MYVSMCTCIHVCIYMRMLCFLSLNMVDIESGARKSQCKPMEATKKSLADAHSKIQTLLDEP